MYVNSSVHIYSPGGYHARRKETAAIGAGLSVVVAAAEGVGSASASGDDGVELTWWVLTLNDNAQAAVDGAIGPWVAVSGSARACSAVVRSAGGGGASSRTHELPLRWSSRKASAHDGATGSTRSRRALATATVASTSLRAS